MIKGGNKLKNNIKLYREKMGISQEKLARLVDISLSQLRNIEKDRTEKPSIEVAIKIKRALNVNDIEELFIIED